MYEIAHVYEVTAQEVHDYLVTLADYDLLKWRLSGDVDPEPMLMMKVIFENVRGTFVVLREGKIVGEFTLTNQFGLSAQFHFSLHPENELNENTKIGRLCNEAPIYTWEKENKLHVPYLKSIYGITPLRNRAACLFALRCGMKKQFILPGGGMHLGQPCDGMVTMKSTTDVVGKGE